MEKENNNIETYTKDMLEALKQGKDGAVREIIEEEEKKEIIKKNLFFSSFLNKFFAFAGIILLFLSLGGLLYFYFKKNSLEINSTQKFLPSIYLNENDFIEIYGLNKEKIINVILNKIKTMTFEDAVEGIYLMEKKEIVDFERFASLVEVYLEKEDFNFINDNFLIGVVKQKNKVSSLDQKEIKGRKDLFFLIEARSFSDAFPIMLHWEKKMFADLSQFFDVDITAENNYLLSLDFKDEIIQNRNARILYDENGNIMLAYVYLDDNSIIITNNKEAVGEVLLRIKSSKIGK